MTAADRCGLLLTSREETRRERQGPPFRPDLHLSWVRRPLVQSTLPGLCAAALKSKRAEGVFKRPLFVEKNEMWTEDVDESIELVATMSVDIIARPPFFLGRTEGMKLTRRRCTG